jgi:outer membrane protein insertion porin family
MKIQMSNPVAFRRYILYIISGCFLLAIGSCSNTKYLPPGESLYTGAKVNVSGPGMKKKQKKTLTTDATALTRPKPNSNVLGLRIKLWIYNIAGTPKKKRSPRAWLKKQGEPPVLLSSINVNRNVTIIDNHLENKGFFQVDVVGDTVVKNRRAKAVYTAKAGHQYTIKEVTFEKDSSDLTQAILKVAPKSLLKPGAPFDLALIKAERDRIDANLKENGFYYFNPDFLIIWTDSTIGNNQVSLYVRVKPEVPLMGREIYNIRDVFIYSQYSLNTAERDTVLREAKFYKGYYVVDRRNRYKPKLFEQAMQFQPGDIYNRTEHNQTLNRLINLGLFKFVKNRFEPVGQDSAKLDTYYYLTPLPKQSLRMEIGGNTKSNNATGTQVTLSWRNRNFFRAGELVTINTQIGSEIQVSGRYRGYNTYRLGIEPGISIPRFVVPFFHLNTKSGFVPKTNIQLGYEVLNRAKLYTLNSFRTTWGYSWKESVEKEHMLNPVAINYVQPINVTPVYLDTLKKLPYLKRSIDKQFIIGSNYNYNFNQLIGNMPMNGIYFNGNLDLSGNVIGLFTGANWKTGDTVKIFNALYSQYVRGEIDFRYYRKLGDNTVLANRIITGYGVPYGNSSQIPFVKQFFVGGNNSVRAFRSRSVGPGSSLDPKIAETKSFLPEQGGDIKLELNTELRQKLFSVVHGALFIDAGNVWTFNEDSLRTPGSKFSNKFISELAVGMGAGIRIDIQILVLRLDVAFPIRKPYLTPGNRWLIRQLDLLNPEWRQDNLVFNLAIGYPF